MKFLKKLLVTLFAFLVIATIILWALAKSVNPEVVKDYVSTQLSTLTAQKSRVDGDISWQVFPRPGIKITGVLIGDENSRQSYSVKLDNLLFNLKITPLLRGKLVFSELNINGFRVNVNSEPESPIKIKKLDQNHNSKANNVAGQFAIERILLSHGKITITKNQEKITLSNLQIGAEEFNFQKSPFSLQLKANFEVSSANENTLKGHVNFKGSTSLSPSLFNNPITALQNTPLEGQLSIQDLKIKQLKVSKINANVKTKTGIFQLNPLTLALYNGQSVGDLSYEFASMKLVVNQTATNLDGNKLIYDLFNKKLFKGSVDFSIHTQANMQSSNWQDTTTGNGNLTIKDGVVQSVNLDKVIDETSNKINKLLKGKKNEGKQTLNLGQFDDPAFSKGSTSFKLLTFQYLLQDAKLQSNSLVLQTDRLHLKGDGELNLKDNSLDSHLLAKVTLTDPEVDKIQQLLGGSFPLLLKGSLTEPVVLPDLKIINPILTKAWIKETLTKPVKQIGQQLKTILTNKKLSL